MLFRRKRARRVFEITEEPEPVWKEPKEEEEGARSPGLEDIKRALSKIGRTQFKANLMLESSRDALAKKLDTLGASLTAKMEEIASDGTVNLDLVKELLPIADGLEEGIRQIEHMAVDDPGYRGLAEGFQIVWGRLVHLLEKWNILPINSVGQRFDPHLHVAVAVEDRSDVPGNTILSEQRKGYRRGSRVIRYAEVVVAKPETQKNVDFPAKTEEKV